MSGLLGIDLIELLDSQRREHNFLSITEILELSSKGNHILDPFSTLISDNVTIGKGNIFYPNVILEASTEGAIQIGNRNTFWPNTLMRAQSGSIYVGHRNILGEGGASISTTNAAEVITIGDDGRYMSGAHISGSNYLGNGSQVLGAILVQECELGDGASFRTPNPDLRGGVLKGTGHARGLSVRQGEVINGRYIFNQNMIERQSVYHPPLTAIQMNVNPS